MADNCDGILFGWGVFSEGPRRIAQLGKRPLVLVGQRHARASGLLSAVLHELRQLGTQPVCVEGIGPEPRVDVVDQAAEVSRKERCDVVVGLGGGSVLDATKAVAAIAALNCSSWEITAWGRSDAAPPIDCGNPLPIVCIPTVTGTGSEANGTGVLVHPERSEKAVFFDDRLRPKVAVVDPALTVTVGPLRTWTGAVDIISHAIEDFLTQQVADEARRQRCSDVTREILEMARCAVVNPGDREARTRLARWAIDVWDGTYNGPDTPWTLHAVAHIVGARLQIAHGLAIAMLLPAWLELIRAHDPDRVWNVSLSPPTSVQICPWNTGPQDSAGRLATEVVCTYGENGILPGWPGLGFQEIRDLLVQAMS